ncbi:hypothetical protein C3489_18295 [Streptomyces sp. Ru71]|nr:hypothetical protein C3489_18295 [Streptomyces sp. Ru71]
MNACGGPLRSRRGVRSALCPVGGSGRGGGYPSSVRPTVPDTGAVGGAGRCGRTPPTRPLPAVGDCGPPSA